MPARKGKRRKPLGVLVNTGPAPPPSPHAVAFAQYRQMYLDVHPPAQRATAALQWDLSELKLKVAKLIPW